MFFDLSSYKYFDKLQDIKLSALVLQKKKVIKKIYYSKFVLSNSLTITISILTLIILLFIFIPNELLYISNILTIIFFVPSF